MVRVFAASAFGFGIGLDLGLGAVFGGRSCCELSDGIAFEQRDLHVRGWWPQPTGATRTPGSHSQKPDRSGEILASHAASRCRSLGPDDEQPAVWRQVQSACAPTVTNMLRTSDKRVSRVVPSAPIGAPRAQNLQQHTNVVGSK